MIEIRFSSEAMRACSTLKNLLDPKQTRKRLQLGRDMGGDQQRDCRRSLEPNEIHLDFKGSLIFVLQSAKYIPSRIACHFEKIRGIFCKPAS